MLIRTFISVAVYLLALVPTLSEARGNESAHAYAREEGLLTERKASLCSPVVTNDDDFAAVSTPDTVTTAATATAATAATPASSASSAAASQQPQRRYWTVTGAPYIDEPLPAGIHPVIGLSTNLLYDITYIPNLGVTSIPSFGIEFYPAKGHWTFGVDVDWSHWIHRSEHRYNQIHNITLSTRRYFKPSGTYTAKRRSINNPAVTGFSGLYLAGSINAAQYGIGWNAHGWEGEGLGVGLGIGYKWQLDHRMYLDLGATAGFFYSRYDPYVWGDDDTGWYYYDYNGDPRDFVRRRMALTWFGPTRIYLSLGVNLFDRNNKRR